MSDHLSAEDLAELERLAGTARQLPWKQGFFGHIVPDTPGTFTRIGEAVADQSALIVAAVNALPRLLVMIKEQGETIAKLRMPEQIARTAADISTSCGISYQQAHFSIMDATTMAAEVERLRAAVERVEALAETWRRKAGRGVWLLDHAAADISTALAGDGQAQQPAACGAPIGAGTYGCPSVYGPPPTCVLPAGHEGLHMRDVSDPSGDRPVAVEPQPEPFDMAPAEIDEFLSELKDPDGGDPQ